MTVTSILTVKGKDVVSVQPTAKLTDAVALLAKRRIGALIVRGAGNRLVGIISERDIVRALGEHGSAALALPVAQVMTREVATCGENDEIGSIMERMTAGKFRHMPVVKRDELVGVISIGDVVKDRLHAMEQETEAMRDYIRSA